MKLSSFPHAATAALIAISLITTAHAGVRDPSDIVGALIIREESTCKTGAPGKDLPAGMQQKFCSCYAERYVPTREMLVLDKAPQDQILKARTEATETCRKAVGAPQGK